MIIVDTNVWSELTKASPNAKVCDYLVEHEPDIYLSVFVIAKIRRGYENPKAAFRRAGLRGWLAQIETDYATRILPFDTDMAHVFGALLARRHGEATLLDLQIAAQALAQDATIATRNVKDFAWTGVRMVNPWDTNAG